MHGENWESEHRAASQQPSNPPVCHRPSASILLRDHRDTAPYHETWGNRSYIRRTPGRPQGSPWDAADVKLFAWPATLHSPSLHLHPIARGAQCGGSTESKKKDQVNSL